MGATSEHPRERGHSGVAPMETPGAGTEERLRMKMRMRGLRVGTDCGDRGQTARTGDRLPVPPVPSAEPVRACTEPRREGMG